MLGEAELGNVEPRVPEYNVPKVNERPSKLTLLYLSGGKVNESAPLPRSIAPLPLDVIWLA
jgi:hypothetical protein